LDTLTPTLAEQTAKEPVASPAASDRMHLDYLDGLRALAALTVMFGHAALQIWPIFTTDRRPVGTAKWVLAVFSHGHYAVSVFIVISGFCLMLPVIRNGGVLKGGAALFFKKRARRILPPYYLAMGCSLLLIWLLIGQKTGTHWDSSLPVTWKGVVAHLLLVQDIYGAPQINHVFWSIAVEWQIYFVFPLLVLLWKRYDGLKTTAGMLILSAIMVYGLGKTPLQSTTYLTLQYFGLFAVGMLAAEIAYSKEAVWAERRARIPWAVFLAAAILIAAFLDRHQRGWIADYFVGFATLSLLILAARSANNPIKNILSWRPFVFLGLYAYSIYLIHAPLLQVVWQYMLHPLHLGDLTTFALLALVGCPLILGGAYLFYLACERPFLTRARS